MNRGPRIVAQAGAVAFRADVDGPRILLVTAKSDPDDWIFPKGHVEGGETGAEAAVRELEEEGGVRGEVVAPAGVLELRRGEETLRVEYYRVRALEEIGTGEDRRSRWCTPDEAMRMLSHRDARELLRGVLAKGLEG